MGNIITYIGQRCKRETCLDGNERHLVGASWFEPRPCVRKTCLKGGKIMVERCPEVTPQPGCRIIFGDSKRPFPDCCDKLSCVDIVDGAPPRSQDDY